jgi:peptidoglycan/LPS O-acetylase OafA/YrhL
MAAEVQLEQGMAAVEGVLPTIPSTRDYRVSTGEDRHRGQRLPVLDGIRGIAIALVVLYHCIGRDAAPGSPALRVFWHFGATGWVGVDLFFVLSGFLIGGILLDQRPAQSVIPFYGRRAFRILPLYFSWVGFWFLMPNVRALEFPLPAYLLFVQNWAPAFAKTAGTFALGATWSLAIEEQFYLLAPWLFRRLSRTQLAWSLFGVVLLANLSRRFLFQRDPVARYYFTFCRADSLAIGCLLAMAYRSKKLIERSLRRRLVASSALLICCSLSVWILSTSTWRSIVNGYTIFALFFALLVWVAVVHSPYALSWLGWAPLRGLGMISYALYLFHEAVIGISKSVIHPELLAILVGLAVSVTAATFSWFFVERHLLAFAKRHFTPPRTLVAG